MITTIFNNLVARYKELEEVSRALTCFPRVTVVGQAETCPAEVFEALFGEPVARATHQAEGGAWEVLANFELEAVPGNGVLGPPEDADRALAFLLEADANVLCLLVDRRPTDLESGLYDQLRKYRRANLVVVNTPLEAGPGESRPSPTAERDAWTAWETELRRVLNDRDVAVRQVRRLRSSDLVTVARAIHERLDERLKLKLIHFLRHQASRDALVVDLINATARSCSFIGLSPIPYADTIAMAPLQVLMVCRIAAVYGQRITARVAADFVLVCLSVLGAGLGWRALYRRVKRRLGQGGLLGQMALGAAVAWAGTQTIGHAARLYFASQGGLTPRQAAEEAAAAVAEQTVIGSLLG